MKLTGLTWFNYTKRKEHLENMLSQCTSEECWRGWQIQVYQYVPVCTSTPAQGGGGNFKNRKPIGEESCCDAWMAERTD